MSWNPHVIENVLTVDELAFITNFCRENPKAFMNSDMQVISQFKDKSLSYKALHRSMPEPFGNIERILAKTRFLGQKAILEAWGEYAYPDNTELTYWNPGDSMSLHADNSWQDSAPDHIKEIEHPTNYRTYSALFYLNDSYDGGEIYFPNFSYSFKPKAGSLITFPANKEYSHGVTEVKNDKRFTIAIWYTDQISYLE